MQDFINQAIEIFQKLNWRPANPADLSKPNLVVWGNLDNEGKGVVCVIDPDAQLFKVELDVRNSDTVVNCKLVRLYKDATNPRYLLESALDALGGLYGDVWAKVVK